MNCWWSTSTSGGADWPRSPNSARRYPKSAAPGSWWRRARATAPGTCISAFHQTWRWSRNIVRTRALISRMAPPSSSAPGRSTHPGGRMRSSPGRLTKSTTRPRRCSTCWPSPSITGPNMPAVRSMSPSPNCRTCWTTLRMTPRSTTTHGCGSAWHCTTLRAAPGSRCGTGGRRNPPNMFQGTATASGTRSASRPIR